MKKNILKEVIGNLRVEKDGYRRIPHKKGWLAFLEDGDMVFSPSDLRHILRRVISDNLPNGNKLLFLSKKNRFTVTADKESYRPEEALERFITASNPDNVSSFFNQVPIGGGKESIDIVIKEEQSKKYCFVELKPWTSTNSPLYAIVESLKNIAEYRIIFEEDIEHDKDFVYYSEVDLIILAPESYYREYGLTYDEKEKISVVKKVLNDLSSEFKTNIALWALPLEENDFQAKLEMLCKRQNVREQQIISISESDAIPELARRKWKLLVESDRKQ